MKWKWEEPLLNLPAHKLLPLASVSVCIKGTRGNPPKGKDTRLRGSKVGTVTALPCWVPRGCWGDQCSFSRRPFLR